jgi:Ca2+/Na+ antiporter
MVARPLDAKKLTMVAALVAFESLAVGTAAGRNFFDLTLPDASMMIRCAALIAVALASIPLLRLGFDRVAALVERREEPLA